MSTIWLDIEEHQPFVDLDDVDRDGYAFSEPCVCTDRNGNYEVLYYKLTDDTAIWYNDGLRGETSLIVKEWNLIDRVSYDEDKVVF